eukprot:7672561-Pyramimonas_sp.AAC.1
MRGFAQGHKSGHDAKLALDGNTAAALTWHGSAEALEIGEDCIKTEVRGRGGGAEKMMPNDLIVRSG